MENVNEGPSLSWSDRAYALGQRRYGVGAIQPRSKLYEPRLRTKRQGQSELQDEPRLGHVGSVVRPASAEPERGPEADHLAGRQQAEVGERGSGQLPGGGRRPGSKPDQVAFASAERDQAS